MLDAKLERLSVLETDNAEQQSINEDLLKELEKRDQAIKEAVELICELEEKVEAVEWSKTCQGSCSPESDQNSPALNGSHGISSSPPFGVNGRVSSPPAPTIEDEQDQITNLRTLNPIRTCSLDTASKIESGKSAYRAPSFIREKKRSTRALRGLFLNNESFIKSNPSLLSLRSASVYGQDEEDTEYVPKSPTLSVLSESSFMSVYGKQRNTDRTPEGHQGIERTEVPLTGRSRPDPIPTESVPRSRSRTDDGNRPSTPSRRSKSRGNNDPYSSIGEVLHKKPSRRQMQHQRNLEQDYSEFSLYEPGYTLPKEPLLAGPIFGGNILPPTPDTMSTHHKDANSSTPSIITEKSLLDGTPYPARNISALVPEAYPYSSNDLDAFSADADLDRSEDESGSVQVEQSDSGVFDDCQPYTQPSTFMGISSKTSRPAGLTPPTRPPLSTYATDMMFNGEGYDAVQPSHRTVSYPTPAPRTRQPPPSAYDAASARSSQLSPETTSSSSITPTRSTHPTTPSRSSSLHRTASGTPSHRSSHDIQPIPATSPSKPSKQQQQQAPPQQHSSLASRIFRRPSAQQKFSGPGLGTFEHTKSNIPTRGLSATFGQRRPPSVIQGFGMEQPEPRMRRPGTAGGNGNGGRSAGDNGTEDAMFEDVVAIGEEAEKGNLKRGGSLRTKMGLGLPFRKGRIGE